MFGDGGVGLLEQELVKVSDQGYSFKAVSRLVQNRKVRPEDKVRLVALFTLRFEGSKSSEKNIRELHEMLASTSVPTPLLEGLRRLQAYCGSSCGARTSNASKAAGSGLFKSSAEAAAGDMFRHTPLLATTINDLVRGKLNTTAFPAVGSAGKQLPTEVIVFFVGGVTYAEARVVNNFNELIGQREGIRIIIGGTHIHNLTSFLHEAAESTR
jgi:vacuolar protein sorting-associated protein 45